MIPSLEFFSVSADVQEIEFPTENAESVQSKGGPKAEAAQLKSFNEREKERSKCCFARVF